MTPDLLRLREKQSELASVIDRLELELVDDPSWGEPSDTNYLTSADRTNPELIALIAAIAGTNKLVSWFGRDREGFVGLWRGTQELPLAQAPVVRLDREGQYSIIAATIPDYIAISVPEDEFPRTRETLTRAGFQVSMNADAIWGALEGFEDPNALREQATDLARQIGAAIDLFEQEDDSPEEMAAVMEPAPAAKPTADSRLPTAARKAKPAPKAKAKAKPAKPKAKAKPAKAKATAKAKPKVKAKAKPTKKRSAGSRKSAAGSRK